ncbi:MAG TPA: biotin/lipoyl-containing protein, partial [Steroidobacteraceae bacterium]|nr:biotin/lipoyl-containing protein [Steroidobacteraceae bacterium]
MSAPAGVVEVRVPDMGNFKDVAVIDVLVKPGDTIAIDTPLVTLESDKATMDVPSTAVGVIEKIHTSKGGTVNTGDLIATVRADGAQRAAESTAAPGREASASPARAPAPTPAAAPAATQPSPAAPAMATTATPSPARAPAPENSPASAQRGAVLT